MDNKTYQRKKVYRQVNVAFTPDEFAKLERLSRQTDRSCGSIVKRILRWAVDNPDAISLLGEPLPDDR